MAFEAGVDPTNDDRDITKQWRVEERTKTLKREDGKGGAASGWGGDDAGEDDHGGRRASQESHASTEFLHHLQPEKHDL